jgi:hypothetical protein
MSQITIQCRLVASESTRRQLWELMADKNTPLINELLQQVGQHPDFLTWRQKGKLPSTVASQLCQPLKTDPRFAGQPSRFYLSAIHAVDYIYKSWLAIQKRLQQKLEGKTHWLEIFKSDAELVETSDRSSNLPFGFRGGIWVPTALSNGSGLKVIFQALIFSSASVPPALSNGSGWINFLISGLKGKTLVFFPVSYWRSKANNVGRGQKIQQSGQQCVNTVK